MIRLFKVILAVLLLGSMACGLWVYAAVPHLISYQGQLTDSEDVPIDGEEDIRFEIYDAAGGGNLLWSEEHGGVLVEEGVFSVILGSESALDLAFDEDYYLQVIVGDDPMTQRQRITSAGYAINAETADVAQKIKTHSGDAAPDYLDQKVDNESLTVDTGDNTLEVKGGLWQVAQVMDPAGVGSVTFGGLSPGKMYRLEMTLRQSGSTADYFIRFNGDSTTSHYVASVLPVVPYDCTVGMREPPSHGCIYLNKTDGPNRVYGNAHFMSTLNFYTDPGNNNRVSVSADSTHLGGYICNTRAGGIYTGSAALSSITVGTTAGNFTGKIVLMELNET